MLTINPVLRTLGQSPFTTGTAITGRPSVTAARVGSTTAVTVTMASWPTSGASSVEVHKRAAGGDWSLLTTFSAAGETYSDTVDETARVEYVPVALNADGAEPEVGLMSTVEAVEPDLAVDLSDEAGQMLLDYGEDATYYPAGGGSRAIRAVVERDPPDQVEAATGKAMTPRAVLWVLNSASSVTLFSGQTNEISFAGISSDELDENQDKIELALRLGEAAQGRRVTLLAGHHADLLKLGVR